MLPTGVNSRRWQQQLNNRTGQHNNTTRSVQYLRVDRNQSSTCTESTIQMITSNDVQHNYNSNRQLHLLCPRPLGRDIKR